jgi:hypothetical protein
MGHARRFLPTHPPNMLTAQQTALQGALPDFAVRVDAAL